MLRRRAFLLFEELLVFIVILLLIIAILLPSLSRSRELAKRSVCAANLSGNGKAIAMYANCYRGAFPLSSKARIRGTGAADRPQAASEEGTVLMFDYATSPIAGQEGGLHRWQGTVDAGYKGQVKYPYVRIDGKDASYAFPSRELFLLVKQSFAQSSQFVCPATGHAEDPLWADKPNHPLPRELGVRRPNEAVPAAQLWEFLGPEHLDYGYMFGHDPDGQSATEAMDPQTPVMADSNPYIRAAPDKRGAARSCQCAKQPQSLRRRPECAVRRPACSILRSSDGWCERRQHLYLGLQPPGGRRRPGRPRQGSQGHSRSSRRSTRQLPVRSCLAYGWHAAAVETANSSMPLLLLWTSPKRKRGYVLLCTWPGATPSCRAGEIASGRAISGRWAC